MKKRNFRFAYLLLAFVLFLSVTNADAQRTCATPEAIQQAIKEHPALLKRYETLERVSSLNTPLSLFKMPADSIITIPVVIHIVLPNPNIITDAQVLSQIEVLNRDYTASNMDTTDVPEVWKSIIGDMHLNFCLAQRTPDDAPTTGIVRVKTSRSYFDANNNAAMDVKYDSTGGSSAWDHSKYLNIWVCNLNQGQTLGVATPPGLFPDNEDGVVVDYMAFGTVGNLFPEYNGGRTCTHEIGHIFNLKHVWGDEDKCAADDGVSDTPLQTIATYGCPSFPKTDMCSPNPPGIMFMNYMDYSNDTCMHLFTDGQILRMDNVLFNYRASLMNSDGCVPVILNPLDAQLMSVNNPQGKICDNSINPQVTLRNYGEDTLRSLTIKYNVDGGAAQTYNWTGELSSLQKTNINLPASSVNTGNHIITAYSISPNGHADEDLSNDTASTSFHLDSLATLPFSEGFEGDSFPPPGWVVVNPDNSYTWQKTDSTSHSGHSAVVIRNYYYSANGATDDLESPVFNITDADSAFVTFYVAAAVTSNLRGTNTYWDSLQVMISQDCGSSSATLYTKYAGNLITDSAPSATEFVPNATQWRKDSINISDYIGKGNFQLIFRNVANYENDIYLDDINVYTKTVNPNLKREGLLVVPNPTTGTVLIEFLQLSSNFKAVAIYNAAGQLVARKSSASASDNKISFDLSNKPNGVYFVNIIYNDHTITKKILKLK